MSNNKKKLKNKIGYCSNSNLHGLQHLSGGHYVYIRKVNKNGTFETCSNRTCNYRKQIEESSTTEE